MLHNPRVPVLHFSFFKQVICWLKCQWVMLFDSQYANETWDQRMLHDEPTIPIIMITPAVCG